MIDFTVGGMVAVGAGIKPAPTASASGGMEVTIGTAASSWGEAGLILHHPIPLQASQLFDRDLLAARVGADSGEPRFITHSKFSGRSMSEPALILRRRR
jgi:hypothetical protein